MNSIFDTKYDFKYLSNDYKAEAFDYIASHYYNVNFGDLSKSDIDLLMFHIYIESRIEDCKDEDGTINYSDLSDYKIGKELGITPQRVKNLKVKKELKYPQKEFNWEVSLRKLLVNPNRVVYEKDYIKINIPDPNLFMSIKDFIEDNDGYVDMQLNSNILKIRKNYFLGLLYYICDEEDAATILSVIEEEVPEEKKNHINKSSKLETVKTISEIALNFSETASNIIDIISPSSAPFKIIKNILNRMKLS